MKINEISITFKAKGSFVILNKNQNLLFLSGFEYLGFKISREFT
jgi:hypothetical protein